MEEARPERSDTAGLLLCDVPGVVSSQRWKGGWWLPGLNGWGMKLVFNGHSVSVWEDEKALERIVLNATELYT